MIAKFSFETLHQSSDSQLVHEVKAAVASLHFLHDETL